MSLCGFEEITTSRGDHPDENVQRKTSQKSLEANHWDVGRGVMVRHLRGDVTDPNRIKQVLEEVELDTAIVLGSHAVKRLSPESRDIKILLTMLVLHHVGNSLANQPKRNLHIVYENEFDMTSKLAQEFGKCSQSDFVDVQQIQSSVLAQTLAYPMISKLVAELFQHRPGIANVVIMDAASFVPLGVELAFGAVQQLIFNNSDGATVICIGYKASSGVFYCPGYSASRIYRPSDELICIRR